MKRKLSTLRFQADADLRFAIVKAVRERESGIDFASAAEARLDAIGDPDVLELAARQDRILITHEPSPGLLIVSQGASIAQIVNAIVLIWSASEAAEWRDQIHHLPSLNRDVFPR
jgi:hypothetical protein